MACEGLMDQEALYLQMLGSADALSAGEDEPVIRTAEGDLAHEPAGNAALEAVR